MSAEKEPTVVALTKTIHVEIALQVTITMTQVKVLVYHVYPVN